jgi:hypothetical protein
LARQYDLRVEQAAASVPRLLAHLKGANAGQPSFVVQFAADAAFLIEAYDSCKTPEGVGPGMRLGDAQKTYGAGRLAPTDAGYLVSFEAKPGIQFLLDDAMIPGELRSVPDDVFTNEIEQRLMRMSSIGILAVRIHQE